jgi:hypothetical protein
MPDYSHAFQIIRHFNDLPDDAIVQTKVTALVLGISERNVRYHPQLPRVQVSLGRYGQRVGDIRALVRNAARSVGERDANASLKEVHPTP